MTLLHRSAAGAVLILAAALLRALALHRLPKRTFLILWGLALARLLLPYSLPTALSAYSLLQRAAPPEPIALEPPPPAPVSPVVPAPVMLAPVSPGAAEPPAQPADIWHVLWLAGLLTCALFFAASYVRCRVRFRASLPVDNGAARRWLAENRIRRPLSIRVSDRVAAPLTFGVFRPVILTPKTMDWDDREAVAYVLGHELVHIRRFDALAKLALAAALCVHWFNPAVWLLYVLANRDLELCCDEAVIRRFGGKSAYALTLLRMEEKRSGPAPLYNSFSATAMQERIVAIMKGKKASVFTIALAVVLIAGIAVAFATSPDAAAASPLPDSELSALRDLQFPGYSGMSIAAYQEKTWQAADTPEYRALLDKWEQDETLYARRDSDADAAFLFYILEPLTAERWAEREFDGSAGSAVTAFPGASEQACVEYWLTMRILDRDSLTVGQYDAARRAVCEALSASLDGRTEAELQDAAAMNDTLRMLTDELSGQWSDGALSISVSWVYTPLTAASGEAEAAHVSDEEVRAWPNGTEADYASLLALMTPGWDERTVADFNQSVLDWANEDYERMERISCDIGWQDIRPALTEEERRFVLTTSHYSGIENAMEVRAEHTGGSPIDPSVSVRPPERQENGCWCALNCDLSWHIADPASLTVGERDRRVSGAVAAIEALWRDTPVETLRTLDKTAMINLLTDAVEKFSGDAVQLSVSPESVYFECIDETAAEPGFIDPLGGAGTVAQGFGERTHPITGVTTTHDGVDIAAERGTAVHAVQSGTVTAAAFDEKDGNYVTIEHDGGCESTYAQLNECIVSAGQSVAQGQVIGSVGASGWATGPHLHFELRYNGAAVNPMDYLAPASVGAVFEQDTLLLEGGTVAKTNVEWWTAEEYAAWLENEKAELQAVIGERAWTQSDGWFVWDQKRVDETIALYEETLRQIQNGTMISRRVDGSEDIMLAQGGGAGDSAGSRDSRYVLDEILQVNTHTEADGAPAQAELEERFGLYGVSFDKNGNMRYQKQLVRCFDDGTAVGDGWASRYVYWNDEGTVDLHAVYEPTANADGSQNPFGRLTGVAADSRAEFDRRSAAGTAELAEVAEAEAVCEGEPGGQTFEELFARVAPYGVRFERTDGARGNVYWNNRLVSVFLDEKPDGGVFSLGSVQDGGVRVRTVYDRTGRLTGVEAF